MYIAINNKKTSRKPIAVQIAFAYLQPFRRNSLLKGTALLKIAKKNNETPYIWSSGSFYIIDVDTTKKLITRACCDRQHIYAFCSRFHGRLANSGKITTFMVYRFLMHSCAGFLERRRSRLGPLKSTFSAENFICS